MEYEVEEWTGEAGAGEAGNTRGSGKAPPHSLEAERVVLGSLLIDPVRIPEAAEKLSEEHFFVPRHAQIYAALLELADRGEPVDFVSVGERLLARKALDKIGGRAYLVELSVGVTSSAHLPHHANLVYEMAVLRRLISEATGIIERAYATRPDGAEVSNLVDESEHAIFSISGSEGSSHPDSISLAVEQAFRRIDSASHRGSLTGLPSGYYDLDELTCGFNAGELVIVAARPSMGKTALMLNVIDHAATHPPEWLNEKPVILFFSLEMGQQSLATRMLCTRARVDAHALKTGRVPPDDYAELARAAGELQEMSIFLDDSPGMTVMTLRSRARRIKQRHGLHMVVVDYLQLMTHPRAESRQMEISQISRSLKELARELEVPVVALSQLSRAVESREDKRPQLSDLRESGSIEQDADVVLLLFRPEYYNPTDENRGLAEVICAKQRNGPTGVARLQFFGSTMRF
ncbi:MAG: replicative DNA helicase, partial [Planctomycetota bacterium]|nr:replicative DNA helicase [Planctomycetota bacterium]